MSAPAVLELPDDLQAPGAARAHVREVLVDWGLTHLDDVSVLLTSEVVTNSLLHAGAASTLLVERAGEGVRVSVTDPSRALPTQRRRSLTATTGRGCQLLDDLAESWGAEADGGGKRVWFVVTVDRDPWADSDVDALLADADL